MRAKLVKESMLNERDLRSIDPLVKKKINQLLALDADYNDRSIESITLTPMGAQFKCWGSSDYANYLKIIIEELGLNKFFSGDPVYDVRTKKYNVEWSPEYNWVVDRPILISYDYKKNIGVDPRTKQVFEELKKKGWKR